MAAPSQSFRRFLSSIPIFGGLEDATICRVERMLTEQACPEGMVVCREGEAGRSMYVVGEGEVLVCRYGPDGGVVRMVRLGPGEFFGEMTLIDPQPRSATVVVQEPSRLYALTNRDLYELYLEDLQGYTMVLQNLCREMARRLRRADERICEMAAQTRGEDTQIRLSPVTRRTPTAK
jgi:CRP/FNR family transcriptional regulator, cyclic AMP receptor protein